MLVITSIGGIFYPMLMAWSLYYMFASWQSQLPWFDCTNAFNTPCQCNHYAYSYRLSLLSNAVKNASFWIIFL